MRRLAVAVAMLALVIPSAASAGPPPPPKVVLTADFRSQDFATYYSIAVTPANKAHVTFWTLTPPAVDPGCKLFAKSASTQDSAVWKHGDEDGCDHTKMGPEGHQGVVTATVSDGTYACTASYPGTVSGPAPPATCTSLDIHRVIGRVLSEIADEVHAVDMIQHPDKKAVNPWQDWLHAGTPAGHDFSDLEHSVLPVPAGAAAHLHRAATLDKLALEIPAKAVSQIHKATAEKRAAVAMLEAITVTP